MSEIDLENARRGGQRVSVGLETVESLLGKTIRLREMMYGWRTYLRGMWYLVCRMSVLQTNAVSIHGLNVTRVV